MIWLSDKTLNSLMTAQSLHKDLCCYSKSCIAHLLQDHYHFGGVYPADEIPPHQKHPVCYIINSDPKKKPGEHWLAYYQDDTGCEFFDSYGKDPRCYPHIYTWLQKAPFPVINLKVRIQGPQAYCGAYVYLYLNERPFYKSMHHLFFESPAHHFNYASRNDTYTPQMMKDYLGRNDTYVFQYLFRNVKQILK